MNSKLSYFLYVYILKHEGHNVQSHDEKMIGSLAFWNAIQESSLRWHLTYIFLEYARARTEQQ